MFCTVVQSYVHNLVLFYRTKTQVEMSACCMTREFNKRNGVNKSIILTLFKSDEEVVLICSLNNQTSGCSISLYGGS